MTRISIQRIFVSMKKRLTNFSFSLLSRTLCRTPVFCEEEHFFWLISYTRRVELSWSADGNRLFGHKPPSRLECTLLLLQSDSSPQRKRLLTDCGKNKKSIEELRHLNLHKVSDMYLKVTLLALLFSGFSGLATFVLGFNLVIVIFGKRIFAAFLDFFSTKYNEVSDSMKVELFKELNDSQPGEKVKKHPSEGKEGEVTFSFLKFTRVNPALAFLLDPITDFNLGSWRRIWMQLQVLAQTCLSSGETRLVSTLCYLSSKLFDSKVVEPNPHFVPFFDQNRAKFPKLDIQDMKQVTNLKSRES